MINVKTRIQFLLLITAFGSACASHYHVGFVYLDDQNKVRSNVSQKVEVEMLTIESTVIEAILNYDLIRLKPLLAPKLSQVMTEAAVTDMNAELKSRHAFTGAFERLKIGDSMPSGVPQFGDNLLVFDFIKAQYALAGSPGADVTILVTTVDGSPKLCGIYIIDPAENTAPGGKVLGYFAPETRDKAGFFRKRERRFGDFYIPVK